MTTEDLRHALSADTRPDYAASERLARTVVPHLTVLYHDDARRIGEGCPLTALPAGRSVAVSRLEPYFMAPGGERKPLASLHLSRGPLWLRPAGDGVEVDAAETSTRVIVDGVPVESGRMALERSALESGAVLQLAESVVLLLHLRDPVPQRTRHRYGLVGDSDLLLRVRRDIERVAALHVPVLLRGETGTGKEMVARALHGHSPRRNGPFVTVNMAAIPSSLAAAELFGAERGAYTGAERPRAGYFEQAHGGTLFLDEIGETPDEIQPLLLRALESGEIQRVGAGAKRTVDVRLIAATDAALEQRVMGGHFRAPLLHRLAGFDVRLPPLTERRDDVGRLVRFFISEDGARGPSDGRPTTTEPPNPDMRWLRGSLFARLAGHDFPGNVRQLKNLVHQLMIIGDRAAPGELSSRLEELLAADHALRGAASAEEKAPSAVAPAPSAVAPVPPKVYRKPADIDEDELLDALRAHDFRILPTAKALGVSRTSLYHMIERSTRVRKPADLSRAELERMADEHDGRVEDMARALEVSKPGLEQRLRQLDLLSLLRRN
ncbi:MAG: sigma 54-interacting transcriptional regulator [Acidobacteriota bacterium]